jgi:hypothetical protein
MNHLQNIKVVNNLAPVSQASAATMDSNTDTLGFEYATILFIFGATANAPVAMSAQHGDAANLSDGATITGANLSGGTETDGTTAALPDDTDDTVHAIHIDLRGLKRYIAPVFNAGSGTNLVSCITILSKRGEASNVPADSGFGTAVAV